MLPLEQRAAPATRRGFFYAFFIDPKNLPGSIKTNSGVGHFETLVNIAPFFPNIIKGQPNLGTFALSNGVSLSRSLNHDAQLALGPNWLSRSSFLHPC
jgi:hypothetical protein